jgi:hypothetical protein
MDHAKETTTRLCWHWHTSNPQFRPTPDSEAGHDMFASVRVPEFGPGGLQRTSLGGTRLYKCGHLGDSTLHDLCDLAAVAVESNAVTAIGVRRRPRVMSHENRAYLGLSVSVLFGAVPLPSCGESGLRTRSLRS